MFAKGKWFFATTPRERALHKARGPLRPFSWGRRSDKSSSPLAHHHRAQENSQQAMRTPFDGEKLSSRIFDEAKNKSVLEVLEGTPEPRSTTAGPDAEGHSTAVTPPMPQTHGLRYAEKQKTQPCRTKPSPTEPGRRSCQSAPTGADPASHTLHVHARPTTNRPPGRATHSRPAQRARWRQPNRPRRGAKESSEPSCANESARARRKIGFKSSSITP